MICRYLSHEMELAHLVARHMKESMRSSCMRFPEVLDLMCCFVYLLYRLRKIPDLPLTASLDMASEKEPTPPHQSLSDRITDRMTPSDDMQIDAEEETDRRNALLDGPLEYTSTKAEPEVKEEQEDDASEEGSRAKGLAGRIAKNRLYTVNETAPDAPDTRVADHVSGRDDRHQFISFTGAPIYRYSNK